MSYVTKTKECRKKSLSFLLLGSPRPFSPPQRPQTSYQPTYELTLSVGIVSS